MSSAARTASTDEATELQWPASLLLTPTCWCRTCRRCASHVSVFSKKGSCSFYLQPSPCFPWGLDMNWTGSELQAAHSSQGICAQVYWITESEFLITILLLCPHISSFSYLWRWPFQRKWFSPSIYTFQTWVRSVSIGDTGGQKKRFKPHGLYVAPSLQPLSAVET